MLLVIGFTESAVFAMVDAFDKPASYVGVVVSVQGVGAVLGGASGGQHRWQRPPARTGAPAKRLT